MSNLDDEDIRRVIQILQLSLTYPLGDVDSIEEDVLRWESEGGSPSHEPVV